MRVLDVEGGVQLVVGVPVGLGLVGGRGREYSNVGVVEDDVDFVTASANRREALVPCAHTITNIKTIREIIGIESFSHMIFGIWCMMYD